MYSTQSNWYLSVSASDQVNTFQFSSFNLFFVKLKAISSTYYDELQLIQVTNCSPLSNIYFCPSSFVTERFFHLLFFPSVNVCFILRFMSFLINIWFFFFLTRFWQLFCRLWWNFFKRNNSRHSFHAVLYKLYIDLGRWYPLLLTVIYLLLYTSKAILRYEELASYVWLGLFKTG